MHDALPPAPTFPKRRDLRPLALLFVVTTVISLGYLVSLIPGRGTDGSDPVALKKIQAGLHDLKPLSAEAGRDEIGEAERLPLPVTGERSRRREIARLLQQARSELNVGKTDSAIQRIDEAGRMDPSYAPSWLAMGDALLAKKDYERARRFYDRAIDLDLGLADAYFGHAAASEGLGDLETALGGMRSFIHVTGNADPYRLKVAQARSAIWEWESKLGRGPWGPTRGIPPGFTEDELKRDGSGVGIKMPKPETQRPDGTMDYEIKAGDPIRTFKKP